MTSERYETLGAKYLADGEGLLAIGDWPQASEKFWGATAQAIKAVATRRGVRHTSHWDLSSVVKLLYEESGDESFVSLMRSANRLHVNFYENDLDPETVNRLASDAKQLITKLSLRSGESDETSNS